MLAILGPLIAALALAQAQPVKTATGEVVDDQGKPVADCQVIFYGPPLAWGKENTVEVQTRTDGEGRFHLKLPPFGRVIANTINGMSFLAYRPDSALTAKSYYPAPYRLVLREPEPRTIRIEGSDGKPIAGARVTPGFSTFSTVPLRTFPNPCRLSWPSPPARTDGLRSDTWRLATSSSPCGSRPTRSEPRISCCSIGPAATPRSR